jgi:PIN domain nuclease of toxin-antitoxin system
VRILLDTHCWLWSYFAPAKLNPRAVTILEDLNHEVFFSIASSWEISIKYQIGKLPGLPDVPARFLPPQLVADRITILPIKHSHVLMVATIPRHHYDPFDHLLVAQAQTEGLTLMTADERLLQYDVKTLWAGRQKPPGRKK